MSSAPPLFVSLGDLRQAASLIEQHGGRIERAADVLRQRWCELSEANDFVAESDVAALCRRAFAELSRSQQICAELATALRLTADALEDADRRAAAIFRCPESSSGGGNSNPPSLAEVAGDLLDLGRLLFSLGLLNISEIKMNSGGYLTFSILYGQISPDALGILGGVAKNQRDFVHRLTTVDLYKVARPLALLDAIPHLMWMGESLSKGDTTGALVSLGGLGLGLGSRALTGRSGLVLSLLQDVPIGVYQAATAPDFTDKREAAIIVKAAAPVVSVAAGHLAGIGVTAVLTAICPIGAPLWYAVGMGAAKLVTSYVVGEVVSRAIDNEATINFLDTHIDSFKSNLTATTQKIVNDVHDLVEPLSRDLDQLFNPNTGSARPSRSWEVWR